MLLVESSFGGLDLGEIHGIKNAAVNIVGELTGSKDCISTDGCQICWDMKGTLIGIKWRYVAVCTDSCSGKKASATKKSGTGAVEHCIDNLFK